MPAGRPTLEGVTARSYSEIAHRDHVFLSPMSPERAGRLVDLLGLSPGSRVLDVCCGKGELLIRAAEQSGASGLGIDISEHYLREARDRANSRTRPGAIDLRCADATTFPLDPGAFDAACWVGGAAQLGSFTSVATYLRAAVRPGGFVLIADLCWKREPELDHVAAFFGANSEFGLLDHAGNAAAGTAAGLTLLCTAMASDDEWDEYEGLCLRAIESWADENPGDPRRAGFLDRARSSYAEYLGWRRDALGFGFYLYRNP
jgi:SAM-dependent methyltransferase